MQNTYSSTCVVFPELLVLGNNNAAIVAQLSCVRGECRHAPEVVQCQNKGFDGLDVQVCLYVAILEKSCCVCQQWECRADMPNGVRFGEQFVVCEGLYCYLRSKLVDVSRLRVPR